MENKFKTFLFIILGTLFIAGIFYLARSNFFPGQPKNELWKTTTDPKTGISFQYPENLMTKYISAIGWPPQIKVTNESFTCTEAGSEMSGVGQTMKRTVNGNIYCVTKQSEGAAGSIYTTYGYAFPKDHQTITFIFTLRAVQCGNYDEAQKIACEKERASFGLDGIVDRMAQSVI